MTNEQQTNQRHRAELADIESEVQRLNGECRDLEDRKSRNEIE